MGKERREERGDEEMGGVMYFVVLNSVVYIYI